MRRVLSSQSSDRTDDATFPSAVTDLTEVQEIRLAQQNAAAFTPLYERYVDAVYGYCLNRVSDPERAADLTSRIFTRALQALPKYRGRQGTFRSWLFTIAHNQVVDSYRQGGRDVPLDDLHVRTVPAGNPGPERLAEQNDLRRAFAEAMAQLTDSQRDVVALRLAGLTGPEIAAATESRLSAVKSTQFRAYARLRELLAPYGDQTDLTETRHE